MKQNGFATILIILLITALVGTFYLGKNSNIKPSTTTTIPITTVSPSSIPKPSSSPSLVEKDCYPESCWIDVKESVGKVGFGLIEAYYTKYKHEDSKTNEVLDCPGLFLKNNSSYNTSNKNLVTYRPEDNIVSLDIDSVDPRYKQMILDSTEQHPLLLKVVQTHDLGHGWGGCGFADYHIFSASIAR